MWWYRDRSSDDAEPEQGPAPRALLNGLGAALKKHSADPAPLLAMSLLIDSRIVLEDGTVLEGPSWFDAERVVEAALGKSHLRLYNQFSKDFDDGYSNRDDLPADHAKLLDGLRGALRSSAGIRSIEPRPRAPADDQG